MTLNYRGTTYSVANTHVAIVEDQTVRHYRGAEWHLHNASNAQMQQPVQALTYRGAAY